MIRIVRTRTYGLHFQIGTLDNQVKLAEGLASLADWRAKQAETDRDAAFETLEREREQHREALRERDRRLDDANSAALAIAAELLDNPLEPEERRRRIAAELIKHADALGISRNMRPFLPDVAGLAGQTDDGQEPEAAVDPWSAAGDDARR